MRKNITFCIWFRLLKLWKKDMWWSMWSNTTNYPQQKCVNDIFLFYTRYPSYVDGVSFKSYRKTQRERKSRSPNSNLSKREMLHFLQIRQKWSNVPSVKYFVLIKIFTPLDFVLLSFLTLQPPVLWRSRYWTTVEKMIRTYYLLYRISIFSRFYP